MLSLDRNKLNKHLKEKGMSLSQFAKKCGISRQSLYNMFRGKSVLSAPMEKLLFFLGVDLEDVSAKWVRIENLFQDAPAQIKKVFRMLEDYAKKHGASLFLIGSRARGKKGIRADWDFAFYFPSDARPADFAVVKFKAEDIAFPYRIDVVNLNDAPEWFLESAEKNAILLSGKMDFKGLSLPASQAKARKARRAA